MKRWWILVAVVVATLTVTAAAAGCGGMQKLIDSYRSEHPGAGGPVAIDDDGDGVPEAYGVDLDADGKADTDEDGKVIEIPGTRAKLAEAAEADSQLGLLATTLAGLGIPAVGVLAGWLARLKPTRRVAHLETLFRGLVNSVEGVRDKAQDAGQVSLADINKVLSTLNPTVEGLEAAVAEAKKDTKPAA